MPKPTKGKRLGGSSSHEDQIISNLISALIEYEKIETTVTKAKTVKPYAEKVITKAKSGTLHDRRQVLKMIQNKSVVAKLFDEIGPKYEDRNGGYTRIIKDKFPKTPISVDTFRSKVAKIAIENGAEIINDISAGNLSLIHI